MTRSVAPPARAATPADFARLGIPVGATVEDAKKAFRQLAMWMHPDRNPQDPGATQRFLKLKASYDAILSGRVVGLPSPAAVPVHPGPIAPVQAPEPLSPTPPVSPRAASPRRGTASRRSGACPIRDMDAGDGLWVSFAAVVVGPDRSCYVRGDFIGVDERTPERPVRIECGGDGYHVYLPAATTFRWEINLDPAGLAVTSLWIGERLESRISTDVRSKSRGNGWCPRVAQLPGHLLADRVSAMRSGERRWTSSEALIVDDHGHCWIDLDEVTTSHPTMSTPVRLDFEDGRIHVVADGHPLAWQRQRRSPGPRHVPAAEAVLGGITMHRRSA